MKSKTQSASSSPRIAIIGAGCSGIAAVKCLAEAGLTNLVCFERNDRVGGNWIYTAGPSHASICETTHIISSKALSQYSDFPMPADYPDYPSHRQVLAYFQDYARHFGVERYIRFNAEVARVEKAGDGWRITLADGAAEEFDYLLLANGHHSVPRHPAWKDDFTGRYLHAHDFRNNRGLEGQRVLVVGAGNSGCDCAVESSRVAAFTAISIRKPVYIIPKFFLGRPTDTFNERLLRLPRFLRAVLQRLSLRVQVGDYRDYGLEAPDFPVTRAHPTLNSELLDKIRHGDVHPRRGVASVSGRTVTFADGKSEDYDVVVAATGYRIAFPFFGAALPDYSEATRIPLYLRMFHPEHPSLLFIGLVQPQGCVWPLSEAQARLAARYILGQWKLPEGNLRQLAEADADAIGREFMPSHRHAIEVHYHPYLRRLQREAARVAGA